MRNLPFSVAGVLAACGGGGGDGGTAPSFDNAREVQPGESIPNASFASDGSAVQAQADEDSLIGTYSDNAPARVVASTDTDGDGAADLVRFSTRGETVEVDFRDATRANLIDGKLVQLTDADGSSVFVTTDDFMAFATFGGWAQLRPDGTIPPGGKVNFGAFGAPTPEASLPSGGPATYTGQGVGLARNRSATAVTRSDIQIRTDFNRLSIASSNTQIEVVDGPGLGTIDNVDILNFTADGPVSGNGFTASGDGMRVDGNFYGPNGEEAAGTFNGDVGAIKYGGAFGATR